MNMGTTRGCPFKCNWCAKPIYGNRYNSRSPGNVVKELQMLKEKYGSPLPSMITFATGPSRTADIEKTLVVGVHGPKEVFCLLVDEPINQS